MTSFGSFSNPNGIAVDESTGDVYVADIGTDTVYKFDASGDPVSFNFAAGSGSTRERTEGSRHAGRIVLVPLAVRQPRGDRGR